MLIVKEAGLVHRKQRVRAHALQTGPLASTHVLGVRVDAQSLAALLASKGLGCSNSATAEEKRAQLKSQGLGFQEPGLEAGSRRCWGTQQRLE